MIKIASLNVENLFARPKALNPADWTIGSNTLNTYNNLNKLLLKRRYTNSDKNEIINHLIDLDIYYKNGSGATRRKRTLYPRWAWLR